MELILSRNRCSFWSVCCAVIKMCVYAGCWIRMNPRWGSSSKSCTNKVLSKKWSRENGSEMCLTRRQVSGCGCFRQLHCIQFCILT